MTSSNKKSRTTTRPNQKGKRGSNSKKTMSPPKESSTLTIILTNVNAYDILLNHYGDLEKSPKPHDIQETIVDFGNEDVGIVDLLHEKSKKSKRSVSFLDPHKGQVKLWGVMIDLTSMGPLPRYTSKPCWWCRNKFSHHPIGCPVRYNTQKEKGIYKDRVEERFTELNLGSIGSNLEVQPNGLVSISFPRTDLKWETTLNLNFGVDFGVNNDRFNGSLDFYRRDTRDLLFSLPPAFPSTQAFQFRNRTLLVSLGVCTIKIDNFLN